VCKQNRGVYTTPVVTQPLNNLMFYPILSAIIFFYINAEVNLSEEKQNIFYKDKDLRE